MRDALTERPVGVPDREVLIGMAVEPVGPRDDRLRAHGEPPSPPPGPALGEEDAGLAPRADADRVLLVLDAIGNLEHLHDGREETAVFEARRCLSCGNCFGCDNCFGMCPDNAIVKLEPAPGVLPPTGMAGLRYEVNLEYCKGCGICAAECPCGAISMVPEQT